MDKGVQTAEDNVLCRFPREDCTTRQQDLVSVMKVKGWRPDALGHPKEKVRLDRPMVDLGSDCQLKYARQRRGMMF